jgi:hypothetical protein
MLCSVDCRKMEFMIFDDFSSIQPKARNINTVNWTIKWGNIAKLIYLMFLPCCLRTFIEINNRQNCKFVLIYTDEKILCDFRQSKR